MVNFTKLAATAQRLIEANGRSVSLLKDNRTPDTAAEPWRGTAVAPDAGTGGDDQTAIAVFVPGGSSASGLAFGRFMQNLPGTLAVEFDQVCLIAADSVSGIDLEEFDRVLDDSTSWRIIERSRLQPGATNLLWALGLKR